MEEYLKCSIAFGAECLDTRATQKRDIVRIADQHS